MHMIKSILLKPFGHFKNKKIHFSPGINLIYADNEEGKTTVFMALQAALLGFTPAGTHYPYFPWQDEELYIEAELFDGRIITRKITGTVSGHLRNKDEITVLANRPIDALSRNYAENFHLLEAEDLYELKGSTLDDIIENQMEKLYTGDGPSYNNIIRSLEGKQKAIYKKRGKNYFLYEIEEQLVGIEKQELIKKQAQEHYEQKQEELFVKERLIREKVNYNNRLKDQIDLKIQDLNKEISDMDRDIEGRIEELSELRRLEKIHENLPQRPGLFMPGLALLSLMTGLFFLGIKVPYPFPLILANLSFVLGLVYLYQVGRINKEALELLGASGFFSREDFLETFYLQRQHDFSPEELLSAKKKRVLELEMLRKEFNALKEEHAYSRAEEEECFGLKMELRRLKEIIDLPTADKNLLLEKREALIEEYNYCNILARLLEASYNDYKKELLPKILNITSCYLRTFSGGNYSKVFSGPGGDFYLQKGKENLLLKSSMSKGLRSQFYLALRLALIEMTDGKLPMFYDEAFSNWDENRLCLSLEAIRDLPRQQFIFTCKKSDVQLYERLLGIKRIDF